MEIRNYMARLSMKTFLIMFLTAGFTKSDASLSAKPVCWKSFNATHVLITCEMETKHPIAECQWGLNRGELSWDPPELSQSYPEGYRLSTCRQSWAINREGSYTVSVRMMRDSFHNNGNHSETDDPVTEIEIEIETPEHPKLSEWNGRITNEFLMVSGIARVGVTRCDGGKPTNTYMTLECPTDPPYTKTVHNNDTVSLGVTIQKKMDFKKCICSAKHITTQILTTEVTIYVLETPDQPTLSASKGSIQDTDLIVTENEFPVLTCSSNGGKPTNTYMTLECKTDPPYTNTVYDIDTVRLYFKIQKDMNGKKCICSAKHITTQVLTTTLTIYVLVPPKLSMYNARTGKEMTSKIIVKDKQTLAMECQSNGGMPAKSKMILSCPSDETTSNHNEYHYTNIIEMSVVFNNDMNGSQCSCSVQHPSGYSSIDLSILIVETPSYPVMSAVEGLIIDSKLIVEDKKSIYVKCKSFGGKPARSHMTIACPGEELHQYTDTIGKYFYFTRNMNGHRCNCSANHISSDESLITLLTITIVVVPQTPSCVKAFDEQNAIITCTTRKVYPQANCQFKSLDGSVLHMAEAPSHNRFYDSKHDTVGYYNASCKINLAITRQSNVTITISMFPELQLRNELEKYYNSFQVSTNFNFKVDPAKIQTFTINKCNPKDVKYVNAKSETTLTCTAFGDPLPTIVISYINSKRESTTLSRDKGYTLSYTLYPTCSDTGLYRCNLSNMLNMQDETNEFNLKVACAAEYYQTTDNLPSFGVPVNEDFNITLSVRVYPEPKNFSLFEGFSTIKQPKKILFTYTNENLSLGEISIAMRLQNEKGLGMYSLRVWDPQESSLYFNLTTEGPPLCPTDFIIENVSTKVMTISFRPGFDGGLRQTFSVFLHDLANNITNSFQVEKTSNDVMVYNVTGLSEGTPYLLSIETKNSKGKTKCPHVNINGTTLAGSKQSSSESYSLILYIGLTAALVIISGVTCGLLYNKMVALKRWCTLQSSHRDLYDTPETREAHSENYYLQPVHSVEQVQAISPNEYDVVFDGYEDASS